MTKCCSCGKSKDNKGFILGVCMECQDYILGKRKGFQDRYLSAEAVKYQRIKDEVLEERVKNKNAEVGLQIIELLKQVL